MEGNFLKSVEEIETARLEAGGGDYFCRFLPEDETLKRSVAAHGVLSPVWVQEGDSLLLIAGHRRVWAAKQAGISRVPALKIKAELSPRDLFLLALLSNWNQQRADLERALMVHKALTLFGYQREEAVSEVLPLLGLPPRPYFVEEFQRVMSLHPSLLSAVRQELLPFRGVSALSRLDETDQQAFAAIIVPAAGFSSAQLLQVGDWLADLLKGAGTPLEVYLRNEEGLREVLEDNRGSDRRQKGSRLFKVLYDLKHPALARHEKRFQKAAREIRDDFPEISIAPPPYFEDAGFTVSFSCPDPDALEKVLVKLEKKRADLLALYQIMI